MPRADFPKQESASIDSSLGLRVFPRDFPETSACGNAAACHLYEPLFCFVLRFFAGEHWREETLKLMAREFLQPAQYNHSI